MKNSKSYTCATLALAIVLTISAIGVAQAGTLENLERERALAIKTFLDPSMNVGKRQAKIDGAERRLIDLERMVFRDKSLKGKNTKTVRVAFANYDLSFLAHASSEKNRTMLDHWMDQFGLSTDGLMSTRIGRR